MSIADRKTFARVYDLAVRVIPDRWLNAPTISPEFSVRELLRISAVTLGVGTARDIADYDRIPANQAKKPLIQLEEDGQLVRVSVAGWNESAYTHPTAIVPGNGEATASPSPFDSLIWKRVRTGRLSGFRSRIELYVLQAARRFGYYVMPCLKGSQLVARVDPKVDREQSLLVVK